MARTRTPDKPKRPTLRDQLREQHEVLMALVTKQPRQAAQTISVAERTSGPQSGDLYVKLDLVQSDDEDDADFVARMETFTIACLEVRDRLNDAQRERRAQATGAEGGE